MKFVVSILSLFLVSPVLAHQVGDVGLVKVLDGKAAYCGSKRDLMSPAYKPTAYAVTTTPSGIRVSVTLLALECKQVGDAFQWELRAFNEPFQYKTFDGRSALLTFRNQEVALVGYDYRMLGALPTSSASAQTFEFDVDYAKLLTPSEADRLAKGETVSKIAEFFLRSIQSVELSGEVIPLGLRAGGSYALRFKLSYDATSDSVKVFDSRLSY
jgi:hypothetical protein